MNITIEIGERLQSVLWGIGSLPFAWFGAKIVARWMACFIGVRSDHL